jgi:ribose 5-phosphate isomerase B
VKRIVITSDYRGVVLKQAVALYLEQLGYDVANVGSHDARTRDNYVHRVDEGVGAMHSLHVERGIFICGSGTGICMRANRYPGIRAFVAHDEMTVQYAREINDANVMCMAGEKTTIEEMRRRVDVFLAGVFSGGYRAERIAALDASLKMEGTENDDV